MPLGVDSRPLLARGSREARASGEMPSILKGERGPRGLPGGTGAAGIYTSYIFKRSEAAPATPTGSSPAGWSDGPPAPEPDYFPLWMSKGTKSGAGALIGTWSAPIQLTGDDGFYMEYIFKRSATQPDTPTGNQASWTSQGWFNAPPGADGNPLWMSKAPHDLRTEEPLAGVPWSTPVQIEGSSVQVQYSVDGLSAWHNEFTEGDQYMRQRVGTGAWSGRIRIVGEDGDYTEFIFKRQSTQPTTPTGTTIGAVVAEGWSDAPPVGSDLLWMSSASFNHLDVRDTPWSTPVRITGDPGSDGNDGFDGTLTEFVWQRAYSQPATPTGNGIPTGWYNDPPAGSNALWMSVSRQNLDGTLVSGTSWSTPIRHDGPPGTPGTDGVDGVNGTDGIYREFVWKRAVSQPATPTGNGIPAGWYDDPPVGTDALWMSVAKQELDGTLVVGGGGWSTPIRHDGPPGTPGTDGVDGNDGIYREFVWKRASSQPTTPTGNGIPAGWYDDPPTGTDPLWMSVARQNADGTLVGGTSWSTPIRHDGPAVLVQYSVNGSTSWHDTFTAGDKYMRQSTDGGNTWSGAIQVVGEEGAGLEVEYSVDGATSWHSTFTTGDLYMRQRIQGTVTWSAAIRIVGETGATGTMTKAPDPEMTYNGSNIRVQKPTGAPTGYMVQYGFDGNNTLYTIRLWNSGSPYDYIDVTPPSNSTFGLFQGIAPGYALSDGRYESYDQLSL